MPVQKKKIRLAKDQRASGSANFESQLAESLSSLIIDPTYVPEEASGGEDSDIDQFPCTFSLLDCQIEDAESDPGEDPMAGIEMGSKRPYTGGEEDMEVQFEQDLETNEAISTANKACEFWKNAFIKVSYSQTSKPRSLFCRSPLKKLVTSVISFRNSTVSLIP